MKLGILKTGAPPKGVDGFGSYPDMFRKLLGEDAYDYAVFDVEAGELPAAPESCPAYLITGSSSGVYDNTPWIGDLTGFLNAAKGRAALVGVCFGHQVMAQAFGGQVIKSPKGWGLGEQTYDVLRSEPWMPEPWMDGATQVRLPGSHQDQVVQAPPGAEVMAASDFTPFGAFAYRDQPAISIQLHPEFDPAYAIALIENRRGSRLTNEEADRAIATYQAPDDRARVGGWIRNFLASATS